MTTSHRTPPATKHRPIPARHLKPGTRAFDRSVEQVNTSLNALLAKLEARIGIGGDGKSIAPLPHHPACGSAPGGSRS